MADFDTKRIRAGYNSADHNYAVNVPIYQTAAFDIGDVARGERLWTFQETGALYTRVGNPTVGVLEERLRLLEEGTGAIALASGMAAISYTFLYLAQGGGNIVVSPALYGGAEDAFSHFLPHYGVKAKFVEDRFSPESYEKAIDTDTKAIFLETISNPNAELYDIEAIAKVAHRHGIPLVVDNTVATPYLFHPFSHGVDVIIYSATKGLSGHGNAIAGAVIENNTFHFSKEKFPQFYEKSYKLKDAAGVARSPIEVSPDAPLTLAIRAFLLEFIGAAIGPFDAYLVLQGLSTISERLEKQVKTTEKIVKFLERRDEVGWVNHPSAADSPYHQLAKKYFPKGTGALLSFGFKGDREQLNTFITALSYFSYQANLGDVRSLIINSPKTTHAELNEQHLIRAGISYDTIRVSVGLESSVDLIEDLKQAFEKTFQSK